MKIKVHQVYEVNIVYSKKHLYYRIERAFIFFEYSRMFQVLYYASNLFRVECVAKDHVSS